MSNIHYISSQVKKLVSKYKTADPFALCDCMNIHVRYMDLGKDIKAYFFYQSRIKNIIINQHVVPYVRNILCAHELGHAVLHKSIATMRGFQEIELFNDVALEEYEANLFAAELLINDGELLELLNDNDRSFFDVAKLLSIPAELLDFKFRVLKQKGYRINPPYYASATFLRKDIGAFDLIASQ